MVSSRVIFCCSAGWLAFASTAFAGPVDTRVVGQRFLDFTGGGQIVTPGIEEELSGGGQRDFPGGSVLPEDESSMSLIMPGGLFINMDGDKQVLRGQPPASIGKNRNGVGNILAAWDEIVTSESRFIQALWMTDNAEDILPLGSPSFFWGWQFGVSDHVEFNPFVTNVEVLTATLALSRDSGASFFTLFSIKGGIPSPGSWPGYDPGIFQSSAGNGINLVLAMYEINPVPAPTVLSAMGIAGLFATRRRR